jgi:RimJ/RimL family protein N-acetyltransferase
VRKSSLAIRFSSTELELHSLLHKSAIKQSRALGCAFLAWAFSQPILRVTAYIIEGLESAKNYCLKLGMTLEGFRRNACIQSGQIKGVYILGMTRTDWSKS